MTQLAVDVIEKLELPVRVVERCAGDLGFTAMKGYDVETWAPGVGEWLEVSSTSDGGSLQADRGEHPLQARSRRHVRSIRTSSTRRASRCRD